MGTHNNRSETFSKIGQILKDNANPHSAGLRKNRQKVIKRRIVNEATIQRHSPEYKVWRKAVFKRDRNTCQKCGRYNCRINAHHILGFKRHKRSRFKLDNGITLCSRCHRKFHEQYGKISFPNIRKVWILNERNKKVNE